MSASGPYACLNGYGHQPYASPLVGNYDTVAGLGTPITTDTIESGSCTGLDQFSNGSASVNIPEIYTVALGGADHQFSVVQHIATASAGSLTIKKGGASRSTTVNSPTSSY